MRVWGVILGFAALAGAAFGLRGPSETAAAPAPAVEPAPAAPAAAPPAPPGETTALLHGLDLLAKARTTADPAMAASLEREALDDAARLAERLRAEPGLWPAVVDVLAATDDLKAVGRVLAALDPAPAEPLFIALLQPDRPVHARRTSTAVLARLDSPESLGALTEALRSDPDGRVRLDVVKALARRRDAAPSEAARHAIEAALRGRMTADPVREVARAARAVLGESEPSPAPPRAPKAPPRFSRPSGPPATK